MLTSVWLFLLTFNSYSLQDNFASDAFFDMAGGLLQLYTNVMLVSLLILVAIILSWFWCISGISHVNVTRTMYITAQKLVTLLVCFFWDKSLLSWYVNNVSWYKNCILSNRITDKQNTDYLIILQETNLSRPVCHMLVSTL